MSSDLRIVLRGEDTVPTPKLPPDKVLVFLFQGGPEDRRSMRFDPPHSTSTDAQVLWAATRMGTIGQNLSG